MQRTVSKDEYGETSIHLQFERYGEMVERARFEAPDFNPNDYKASRKRNYSSSGDEKDFTAFWSGTPNWETAEKLVVHGWPEGPKETGLESLLEGLTREIASMAIRDEPVVDTSGLYIDMDEYLRGSPECFITPVDMQTTGNRIVRLCISLVVSHTIRPAQLAAFGACAVALIDLLESRNYRVELTVCFATKHTWRFQGDVTVKQSNEPVAMENLNFILAHPASLRRIWFAVMEAEDAKTRTKIGVTSAYGIPRGPSNYDDYDMVICPSTQQPLNMEGCIWWVKDQIARLNETGRTSVMI